jgi:hypothetical protein
MRAYPDSLKYFNEALGINPEDSDIQHKRDVVKQKILDEEI